MLLQPHYCDFIVVSDPKLTKFGSKRRIPMLESTANYAAPALSHLLPQASEYREYRWSLDSYLACRGVTMMADSNITKQLF